MKIQNIFLKYKKHLGQIGKLMFSVFAFFALIQASFAIGISPVRTELDLAPGESKTVTLTVTNQAEEDIQAVADVEAFLRNDEQGFPIPIEMVESDIHNIRNWIDISTAPIDLPANGVKEITFTVNVPEGAEPGGKYVLIAYKPVNKSDAAVTVVSRVASLVLINVKGYMVVSGDVDNFALPEAIYSDKPFGIDLKFSNIGNTHVKPEGWIEIVDTKTGESLKNIAVYTDPASGETITSDKIPVNINGGNVLPDSKRIFTAEWNNNLAEGEFKALLSMKYSENQNGITKELGFGINEDLKVDSFIANIGETEAGFSLSVTNSGGIYEKLKGSIEITNDFGYKVAEVLIPDTIEYVAPGESRTFNFDWLQKEIPKGRYTAVLKAKHGVTNSDLTAEVSFGNVNYAKWFIAGGVIVLILILAAVVIKKRRK